MRLYMTWLKPPGITGVPSRNAEKTSADRYQGIEKE